MEQFARNSFDVCHKITPKINSLHITGVSDSGKSYILRSIKNGLMNCGRMRCQASDNFTFGSCVDKTLIYTDEIWFTSSTIEEAKCILEGTETYVNVKHQNERILRRTLCISTSNVKPWRHVLGDKQTLLNRMHYYETRRSMHTLKEWGKIELNPIMCLTIWKRHINAYINNEHSSVDGDSKQPEPAPAKKKMPFRV